MKKLDQLLAKSFIGPFLVAFIIALFAFLMQYLWVYIDEIIGKGAGLFLIIELVSYLSISMMPMALPVAVLIASVMTMGNLSEHYELAAIKSAGVPLFRTMMPLMALAFGVATFSFLCSNYLIPVANLKAKTRLYDIRKQKPSLSLDVGAFNDDFQGFAIRIGSKDEDGKSLTDVMLFKQGLQIDGRLESVNAKYGKMEMTPDNRYFVMELKEGFQYQQPKSESKMNGRTYPFIRTKFDSYRKAFDLSEFEIDRTDEDAFKNHESMLSVSQLAVASDSIKREMDKRRNRLGIEFGRFFSPMKVKDKIVLDSIKAAKKDSIQQLIAIAKAENDTVTLKKLAPNESDYAENMLLQEKAIQKAKSRFDNLNKLLNTSELDNPENIKYPNDYKGYLEYIGSKPNVKRHVYAERGIQFARSIKSYSQGAERRIEMQKSSLTSHIFEMHSKWNFALACFLFLFIGAPMGAIIRKGGFGYPILVSIIFFTIFIILMMLGRKLMGSQSMNPVLAAWLPSMFILPFGAFLTYAAMNDLKFSIAEQIGNNAFIQKVITRFKKNKQ